MWKRIAVILAIIFIIAIVVVGVVPIREVATTVTKAQTAIEMYYAQEAYTEMEQSTTLLSKQEALYSETVAVDANKHEYVKYYIDVASKINNLVKGNVTSLAGGDFAFYVFDQHNYLAWRDGQTYQAVVAPGKITDYSFSFIPKTSDYYYFVFDNTVSVFANKLIKSEASWSWQQSQVETKEVTKYRYVPKAVSVCKLGNETTYKKVSLLDYAINY